MGPNGRFNLEQAVADAPPCTEVLDVTTFLKTRKAASRFYSDQISVGPPMLRALEYAPVTAATPISWKGAPRAGIPAGRQSTLIPSGLLRGV